MSQELENTDKQEVAIIDENQIKQFQSLYYLFKGKRDTEIKLFDSYKQFSYQDIIELNDKVYKKLELHEKLTDLVHVTVGLDNNEIRTFGNWYEFTQTDWQISARTKYISLEWDFNIILPNQVHKVPQTHTLRVRIGNNLKPSEMIQVVFQGSEEYELEEVQSQMVCKIDFVNAQICSELKTVVSEWYEALLRNSEDHKLIKSILKHEVKTYFLDYYSLPPVYNKSINSVTGQVLDRENNPLPGATVMVPETTIGAVTDMNGNYSITLPNNAGYLSFSFIGFKTQTLPITSSVINVKMVEDDVALQEVVVVGYGVQEDADISTQLQGRVAGVSVNKTKSRDAESIAIPFEKTENQTSINFEISTPYSVNSDNKNYSVDMVVYQVPAFFQYYSVPKIEKEAYLIANITDWEKYNLLEGEANIFFEGTFVGKSLLDVRFASDTLQLSLGKDKNVIVNREKEKDFETRQFIGSKKEESKSWKTTIKNNKSQEINMVVLDQAPVSKLEEIEVNIQNISNGKLNKESGEVKWEFTLKPMEKKEFDLIYSVKYPKSRNLTIE